MSETVIILGASNKPDRYAYKAQRLLMDYGHTVIPVHPVLDSIEGVVVRRSLEEVLEKVDTITIYMRPERWEPLIREMKRINPRRVILNPGTESGDQAVLLKKAGIDVLEACTLVMLRTGQF